MQALRGVSAVRCSHSLQRVEDLQKFLRAMMACSKLRSLALTALCHQAELNNTSGFTGFLPFALLQFVGQRCDAAAHLRQRAAQAVAMKKTQPWGWGFQAPRAGFEPATNRLTVDRSTAELPRNAALTGARRTYPSALPARKGGELSLQRFAAAPRPNAAPLHQGGSIAPAQLFKAMGDP